MDVGLSAYTTDSTGQAVENPKYLHRADTHLKRHPRIMSRRSVHHKTGKKPHANHAARRRARQNQYPATTKPTPMLPLPTPTPAAPLPQSANWQKARQVVAKDYLKVQRQREDFARKAASVLTSSNDLVAPEDLQIRHMVRNQHLAKAISDARWGRFQHWVKYYGRISEVPVIVVPSHYASQDCSGCGKWVWKSLSVRTHVCPHCGLVLGRDHNSAILIRDAGLVIA